MDGFQRLILRITPIIMLICCICLGITHIFSRPTDRQPITYLTNEIYTVQTDNPETTEINESITIDNYYFDFQTYRSNISANKLKEATENVIDLETYNNTLSNFNLIWENGYQPLDILKTILNGILLVINTFLSIINIIILPVRIITAILITALSIMGININRTEGIIIPFLNAVIKYANIPLIGRTDEETSEQYENLSNTTWLFNDNITIAENTVIKIENGLNFTSNNEHFKQIIITRTKNTTGLLFRDYYTAILFSNDNITRQVYTEGNWLDNNYKTIYINTVTNESTNQNLYIWLEQLATKQTVQPTNPQYGYTYEWNTTKLQSYRPSASEYYSFQSTFESNNEQYGQLLFVIDETDEGTGIIYYDLYGNANLIYRRNIMGFSNQAYERFTLTQTQTMNSTQQSLFNMLINNNFITLVTE